MITVDASTNKQACQQEHGHMHSYCAGDTSRCYQLWWVWCISCMRKQQH